MLQNPHFLLTFDTVQNPLHLPRETIWPWNVRTTTACTFSTSQLPIVLRGCGVLHTLTWKCASRHNCKCSECEVLLSFSVANVLRATTACTFLTSQLLKVVRRWCVLYILTWKCASRHNHVQFFISHLESWLRTRRCSEPTFRPSGATNHAFFFRDFPTFSRTWIFFLLRLSLFWSSFFFSSSLLFSDSSHLCFSSVHTVEVWLLNFLRLLLQQLHLRLQLHYTNHTTPPYTTLHYTKNATTATTTTTLLHTTLH